MSTPDILQKILRTKQEEIAARSAVRSLTQLQAEAASASPGVVSSKPCVSVWQRVNRR